MSVFLTHHSSLRFWRHWREFRHCNPAPVRARGYLGTRPAAKEIGDACARALPGVEVPHVSLPGSLPGTPGYDAVFHRWACASERGSYARAFPGVYVASPEYLFLEMASFMELEHLIEFGYELCGRYVPSNASLRGFAEVTPLTTAAKLALFLSTAEGHRGLRKARRAVRQVLDGAESPRECVAMMLLTLPYLMGGNAVSKPALNVPIELTPRQQVRFGRSSVRCDAIWRDVGLALEYESDAFHSGQRAFVRDSKRRNDLRLLGIDVVTMTNEELKSRDSTAKIADAIVARCGQRRGVAPGDLPAKQRRLRRLLLDRRLRQGAAHVIESDGDAFAR